MDWIKHQLFIHVDYNPEGSLEIRYSYPLSGLHRLDEQVIIMQPGEIPSNVKTELESLRDALKTRIQSPMPVRLPSAAITPTIQERILTVVIQDQRRRLPVSRLYYLEIGNEIDSQIEREVPMGPQDFSESALASWKRLRDAMKGVAWKDYVRLVQAHLLHK